MTAKPDSQPNLIYIFADDMGYGDVSYLNENSKILTTHIDRLGREGLVFRDAHASSAVCTPSRYSVLTGRYNWRSVMKEGVGFGYSPFLLEPNRMTVASYLREQGYRTACVGKWHLGLGWAKMGPAEEDVDYSKPITDGPCTCGFDTFFGISASLDMEPYVYIRNDRVTALPTRTTPGSDLPAFWRKGPVGPDFEFEQVLPRLTEEALAVIDAGAAADQPFFLYFPLPAPHTPILPLPEFQGKSHTNAYGDFCLQVDNVVGQIMEKLDNHGISDNTIVVFTSDNGCAPMANLDELAAVGHYPSYVFRGHKADIYEGGHRIPLLMRWPGRIAPGQTSDQTVCLADLMATMADVVGAPLPDNAGEDSVSNLAVWLDQDGDKPIREATVHHSVNGSFSIRQGRWKLELCPGSGGWSYPAPGKDDMTGLPPMQLYDLNDDIGERRNRLEEEPEVAEQLKALLTRYIRNGRSTPGEPQPNTGPEWWPQLHWLAENG